MQELLIEHLFPLRLKIAFHRGGGEGTAVPFLPFGAE